MKPVSKPTTRRFHPKRAISLACFLATAVSAGSAVAEISEAELIKKLEKPAASVPPGADPDAVFASGGMLSKNSANLRLPDTKGVCTPAEKSSSSQKTLVIVPMAPSTAPKVDLALNFELASYRLTTSDKHQLESLARAMKSESLRDSKFTIAGHTDALGDPTFNEKLSCGRALATRDHLVQLGISPDRISAYGFGSSQPLVTGSVAAPENRRVEIRRSDL